MNFLSIFLTAFALSMDAFTVSITKGMTLKKVNVFTSTKIALFFGIFQGIMPVLGWFIGIRFKPYIKSIDHCIALILLCYIGLKMISEVKENTDLNSNKSNTLDNKELIILSIATSIDALAVGISFAFLNEPIMSISFYIAIITFLICFSGVLLGKSIGYIFKDYAQIVGGVILIIIGFNIFNEHTHIISHFF